MELGNNIYRLRREHGLSQEKLAEKINVTRQTISNWELNVTAPNPEQLILLSREFNVSIDALVGNILVPAQKEISSNRISSRNIYMAFAIICSVIAGVLAFSAFRFRYVEILIIAIAGAVAGMCLGIVFNYVLKHVNRQSE